jgi:hypothetical protein
MPPSAESFIMEIYGIQPTQLYISSKKLARVIEVIGRSPPFEYEPIPVKELNGRVVYSDGHTRAFALHRLGVTEIQCCWEDTALDWDEYEACVGWCLAEGIKTIADLDGRVVGPDEYKRLWLDRCAGMQKEMENKRKGLHG